jgi:hypothetical protein
MTYDLKKKHLKLQCQRHVGPIGLICRDGTKTCRFRHVVIFCGAAAPPPTAPLLSMLLSTLSLSVLTSITLAVLTHCQNCSSRRRASSCRSVVVIIVVVIVVIIVILIVFVIIIVVVVVVIILVVIVVVFVVIVIIVVCLHCCCCPIIMRATQ